jgi:hypothetical protein
MTSQDEEGINMLQLAVDACVEADRANEWKAIAKSLAAALYASGWTPHSGGTDALNKFQDLLNREYLASVKS